MDIYIVDGASDRAMVDLFANRGHTIHTSWHRDGVPDLTVFTGGADISPHRYGEENVASYVSEHSLKRDEFEFSEYVRIKAIDRNAKTAGICRGAQLQTIVNGGRLLQDVQGHHGTHQIHGFLEGAGSFIWGTVNSCHHQVMVPPSRENVLAISDDDVPEIVLFGKDFGIQGHPEWEHEETTEIFFKCLKTYLGLDL